MGNARGGVPAAPGFPMQKKRKDFFSNANSGWEAEDSKVDLFLPDLLKPHTPEAALAPGEHA